MKKLTKILSILVISILSFTLMTGCGKVDPPETFAQGFYDLLFHGDTTTLESMGVPEDEISPMKDFVKDEISNSTKNNFKIAGLTITDEELNSIVDAELNALKKVQATITTESSDKQTAVVKIKTNYINITEVDEKAANDALAEVQAMGISDRQQLLDEFAKKYTAKLIEGLTALEPSEDTVEKSFSFTMQKVDVSGKSKNMWVPENPTTLGKDVSTMVVK
ncbi:DUF5105 domain-containing protein [uncultured Clostridium sp.]|uniref:DUF5105 domain-containing protein n=1 Tax=uncultured Clostridium sp. TaxID=59620 RepID=UPI0025CD5510|nr:DUF5105 domain-containing protein [uncultured Clostridium sp.]